MLYASCLVFSLLCEHMLIIISTMRLIYEAYDMLTIIFILYYWYKQNSWYLFWLLGRCFSVEMYMVFDNVFIYYRTAIIYTQQLIPNTSLSSIEYVNFSRGFLPGLRHTVNSGTSPLIWAWEPVFLGLCLICQPSDSTWRRSVAPRNASEANPTKILKQQLIVNNRLASRFQHGCLAY